MPSAHKVRIPPASTPAAKIFPSRRDGSVAWDSSIDKLEKMGLACPAAFPRLLKTLGEFVPPSSFQAVAVAKSAPLVRGKLTDEKLVAKVIARLRSASNVDEAHQVVKISQPVEVAHVVVAAADDSTSNDASVDIQPEDGGSWSDCHDDDVSLLRDEISTQGEQWVQDRDVSSQIGRSLMAVGSEGFKHDSSEPNHPISSEPPQNAIRAESQQPPLYPVGQRHRPAVEPRMCPHPSMFASLEFSNPIPVIEQLARQLEYERSQRIALEGQMASLQSTVMSLQLALMKMSHREMTASTHPPLALPPVGLGQDPPQYRPPQPPTKKGGPSVRVPPQTDLFSMFREVRK